MKAGIRIQVSSVTICIIICIALFKIQPVNAAINTSGVLINYKIKTELYPAFINEKTFLHNKNSVKIYLDASKKKVHVITKENNGKQIDFFLFDLEGTLIYNHKLKVKDHHKVTNLIKGVYVYRVFCGDEETATGQLEIQ